MKIYKRRYCSGKTSRIQCRNSPSMRSNQCHGWSNVQTTKTRGRSQQPARKKSISLSCQGQNRNRPYLENSIRSCCYLLWHNLFRKIFVYLCGCVLCCLCVLWLKRSGNSGELMAVLRESAARVFENQDQQINYRDEGKLSNASSTPSIGY